MLLCLFVKIVGLLLTDNEMVAELLVAFNLTKPGNMASLTETEMHHTGVISFSTEHMGQLARRFPEVLLLGCTHKTNK